MLTLSRSAPPADIEPVDAVYEGVVWFLTQDTRRARWIIQKHLPDHHGWCSHQGAIEQYRWPCRLYQCAHDALIQAVPTPRVPARSTPQRSKAAQYG